MQTTRGGIRNPCHRLAANGLLRPFSAALPIFNSFTPALIHSTDMYRETRMCSGPWGYVSEQNKCKFFGRGSQNLNQKIELARRAVIKCRGVALKL